MIEGWDAAAVSLLRAKSSAFGIGLLAELEYGSGTMRVWRGGRVLTTTDGREWQPLAGFGSVSDIEGGVGLQARGVELALTRGTGDPSLDAAVDAEQFAAALVADLDEDVQGRRITLYVQVFDVKTLSPLGPPAAKWTGRMGEVTISLKGTDGAGANMTAEGLLAEPRGARHGFLTDADQRTRFEDDKSCEFTTALPSKTDVWYS